MINYIILYLVSFSLITFNCFLISLNDNRLESKFTGELLLEFLFLITFFRLWKVFYSINNWTKDDYIIGLNNYSNQLLY